MKTAQSAIVAGMKMRQNTSGSQ